MSNRSLRQECKELRERVSELTWQSERNAKDATKAEDEVSDMREAWLVASTFLSKMAIKGLNRNHPGIIAKLDGEES